MNMENARGPQSVRNLIKHLAGNGARWSKWMKQSGLTENEDTLLLGKSGQIQNDAIEVEWTSDAVLK